jgi:hypothetical protein
LQHDKQSNKTREAYKSALKLTDLFALAYRCRPEALLNLNYLGSVCCRCFAGRSEPFQWRAFVRQPAIAPFRLFQIGADSPSPSPQVRPRFDSGERLEQANDSTSATRKEHGREWEDTLDAYLAPALFAAALTQGPLSKRRARERPGV